MNTYLLIAAILTFVLGLAHSAIGEVLIFRHWRGGEHVEKIRSAVPKRHRGIIWASWHLVTIFGWEIGAVLFWIASPQAQGIDTGLLEKVILISMLVSAALVLVGTRGKHPGWVIMSIIAALVWAASF